MRRVPTQKSMWFRLRRFLWNSKCTIAFIILSFHIGLFVGLRFSGLTNVNDPLLTSKGDIIPKATAHGTKDVDKSSTPPLASRLQDDWDAPPKASDVDDVLQICSKHYPELFQNVESAENETKSQNLFWITEAPVRSPEPEKLVSKGKVLIFTMDSLAVRVDSAASGGASGEIRVRTDLQKALTTLGMEVLTATSDEEFRMLTDNFQKIPVGVTHVILDEWTLISPNFQPRDFLRHMPVENIYLLAFFGKPGDIYSTSWLRLPASQILTAYPYTKHHIYGQWNTFLGFYFADIPVALSALSCTKDDAMHNLPTSFFHSKELEQATATKFPDSKALDYTTFRRNQCLSYTIDDGTWSYLPVPSPLPMKQRIGLLWGKDFKYFAGKGAILQHLLSVSDLKIFSSLRLNNPRIEQLGHLPHSEWVGFLKQTAFLVGLGDPVLGPSALEAIAYGAVYINPVDRYAFETRSGGVRENSWTTQHPFALDEIGYPYVCNYSLQHPESIVDCVEHALSVNLPPYVHSEYTRSRHLKRVKSIFFPSG